MNTRAEEMTSGELIEEFNAVVTQMEQMLKSVANSGGERAGALRFSVEQNLAVARDRLRDLQQAAAEKTQAAARAANDFAHRHPWQAIGVATGMGAVIGVAIGLLLNRR